ncbi:MAG: hypothetical protein IH875_11505 [Candidatus Dadabacteria bacterium]|nr:hypothetical protein [Candidatus Dadabacteria bacterium]
MIGSLRIMHFGFLISVIVAVLIIGKSLDASAQTQGVECPCDFESVPKVQGCWVNPFESGPAYIDDTGFDEVCVVRNGAVDMKPGVLIQLEVGGGRPEIQQLPGCEIKIIDPQSNPNFDCNAEPIILVGLSTEEVLACQCELLAYTTALNEGGISVSGGPPYECGNVDLRTCQVLPASIPTLNEYGMIITAGVLGLLAVIGLFVMRTRRTVAGGRGPDGANQ